MRELTKDEINNVSGGYKGPIDRKIENTISNLGMDAFAGAIMDAYSFKSIGGAVANGAKDAIKQIFQNIFGWFSWTNAS